MRIVDDYLIGTHDAETDLLSGGYLSDIGFPIYDEVSGIDPMSPEKVTISYPVPFATYTSSIGDDAIERLSGRRSVRSVFVVFTYVGSTRTQAKAAGERLRARLERHRPVIEGHRTFPIKLELGGSDRVRRDDAVMRPDGSPLYFGIERYSVSLALKHTIEGALP